MFKCQCWKLSCLFPSAKIEPSPCSDLWNWSIASAISRVDLLSVEHVQMMMVSAREWNAFSWKNLRLVAGRMPRDSSEPAVVLGRTAADLLRKKVGDKIQIETAELTVVGIVDGSAWVE